MKEPPMPSATVSKIGQITIPQEVRNRLGLKTGDRLDFVEDNDGIYRVFAATKDVRDLKGIVQRPQGPVRVDAMKDAARRAASRS